MVTISKVAANRNGAPGKYIELYPDDQTLKIPVINSGLIIEVAADKLLRTP